MHFQMETNRASCDMPLLLTHAGGNRGRHALRRPPPASHTHLVQGGGGRTCHATALLSRTKVSSSGCSPDWSSLPPTFEISRFGGVRLQPHANADYAAPSNNR